MINIRWLQALRAVVRSQSVTEAAAMLNVTQPAVSRMIASLELELGFAVFLRHKGRLQITSQGEAFYAEVERTLEDLDGIRRIGESIRKGAGAVLRISSTASLIRDVFPPVLKAFHEKYPSVQVSLSIRGSRDILGLTTSRQFDFGIVVGPSGHELAEPFGQCPAMAVMAPDHPLAQRKSVTLADLAEENLILVPATGIVRRWIDGKFAEIGKIAHARVEVSSTVAISQMAAAGLGVAIADPFAIHSLRNQPYVARLIEPAINYSFSFIKGMERQHSPHAVMMMELIEDELAERMEATVAAALTGV